MHTKIHLENKKNKNNALVSSNGMQAKLSIGKPNDKYEQEADTVADRVMKIDDPDKTQMQPIEEEEESIQAKIQMQAIKEEEEPIQMQPMEEEEESMQMKPAIQKSTKRDQYATSEIGHKLNSTKGSGKALPNEVGTEMGRKIGGDFSDTKIHTDSKAVNMNRQLGAQAFTHGNDIYFNKGKYNPESSSGKHLLAHELTHVIQQSQSILKRKKLIQKQEPEETTVTTEGTNESEEKTSIKLTDFLDSSFLQKVISSSNEDLYKYLEQVEDDFSRRIIQQILIGNNPYKSYIGKQFKIDNDSAVIRDENYKSIKYTMGEEVPEGKNVGDNKEIPNGIDVHIVDYKFINSAKQLVKVVGYGWTSASNLKGGFYNETIGISEAPAYDSEAPNHKTVAKNNSSIRVHKGYIYKERKPRQIISKDEHPKVLILDKSDDNKYVLAASSLSIPLGWTAASNLDMSKPDESLKPVTSSDARLRDKVPDYSLTGNNLPLGTYVIVKETSNDTIPTGQYTKVAYVKKEGENFVEDTGKSQVWTSSDNLADGWSSDLKGPNAQWEKGKYIGQVGLVDIVGKSGDNQKIRKVGLNTIDPFKKMTDAAYTDGVSIKLISGFRSFPEQKYLDDHENEPGFNPAATPGYSDHQRGLAFDLNNKSDATVNEWLKKNAWEYGFLKTYKGYKEHHHWEYRPELTKKPEEVTIADKKYTRYYFASYTHSTTSVYNHAYMNVPKSED